MRVLPQFFRFAHVFRQAPDTCHGHQQNQTCITDPAQRHSDATIIFCTRNSWLSHRAWLQQSMNRPNKSSFRLVRSSFYWCSNWCLVMSAQTVGFWLFIRSVRGASLTYHGIQALLTPRKVAMTQRLFFVPVIPDFLTGPGFNNQWPDLTSFLPTCQVFFLMIFQSMLSDVSVNCWLLTFYPLRPRGLAFVARLPDITGITKKKMNFIANCLLPFRFAKEEKGGF